MKTELEIVPQIISPGRRVLVTEHPIRNYQTHQTVIQISRLCLGMMESDSANSMAQNSARDTRNFWNGWALIEAEWANAKQFRDSPHAKVEHEFIVLLPHLNEIMLCANIKIQRCAYALYHLATILNGTDSATMQTWIGPGDIEGVDEAFAHCKTVLTQYLGTGVGDAEKGFNTGFVAPEYATGQTVPDLDLDKVKVYEPSTEQPVGSLVDTADLPSLARRDTST